MKKFRIKNPLRIIVLMHESLIPPDTLSGIEDKARELWRTEYDVVSTLRSMGHDVLPVGLHADLSVIAKALAEFKPHIAFNVLEEFDGYGLFDQHVVSYLELMKQPYTGSNPRGLTICHDKALTKKILAYHRIHVPNFAVFPLKGRVVRRPGRLAFPLLVKSVTEEGSAGISQASIVTDDEKLADRVAFIHRQTKSDAIAEQYIEGREIYVSILGNHKLQVFAPWELKMSNLPEGQANIATGRLKWNKEYQKRVGSFTEAARLSPELKKKIEHVSKRIYRILGLSGYARLDYRLTENEEIYLLEANPNPQIALDEEFADSAAYSGLSYPELLQKIVTLGLGYSPQG
jgi:D-alanine-D-alanine ligase